MSKLFLVMTSNEISIDDFKLVVDQVENKGASTETHGSSSEVARALFVADAPSRYLYSVCRADKDSSIESIKGELVTDPDLSDVKIFDLSEIDSSGIKAAGMAEAAKKTIGFMAAATGTAHAFFGEHLEDNPNLIYYIIPISVVVGFILVGLPAAIMKQFLLASHAFSSLFERYDFEPVFFDSLLNQVFENSGSLSKCLNVVKKCPSIIPQATYAELPEDLAMVLSMLAAANLPQERLIAAIATVILICWTVRVETSKQFWYSIIKSLQVLSVPTDSLQGRDQFLATCSEGDRMLELIDYYKTSNQLREEKTSASPHELHELTSDKIFEINKDILNKAFPLLITGFDVNPVSSSSNYIELLQSATNNSAPKQIKTKLTGGGFSSEEAKKFIAMRYLISKDSRRSRIAYALFEFWVGGTALASMAMLLPAIGSAAIRALAPELYRVARSETASGANYIVGLCLKHNLYVSAAMALPFVIFSKLGFKGFYLLDIAARGRATLIMSAETMLGVRSKTRPGEFLYKIIGLHLGPRGGESLTYIFQKTMVQYNNQLSKMTVKDVEKNIMSNLVFSFALMLGISVPNGLIADLVTWSSEEKGFLIQLAILMASAVIICSSFVKKMASAEYKAWGDEMINSARFSGKKELLDRAIKLSEPNMHLLSPGFLYGALQGLTKSDRNTRPDSIVLGDLPQDDVVKVTAKFEKAIFFKSNIPGLSSNGGDLSAVAVEQGEGLGTPLLPE